MLEPKEGTGTTGLPASSAEMASEDQPMSSPESQEAFSPERAQEYYEAFRNQQQWQKTNTQRAQELAEQRNQITRERQRLEQIHQTVAQQQQLASRLIEQAAPKPQADRSAIPDPLDQPEDFKRWASDLHGNLTNTRQEIEVIRKQQRSYAQQWADRLTRQSLGQFQSSHPELTEDQMRTIAQTIRERILPAYTEEGLPYYDMQQLEDGYNFVMGQQRIQEARREGREEVVQNAQKARAAQALSGRKASAPVQKDLAYYVEHFDEFQRLTPERKMELLTPPEM